MKTISYLFLILTVILNSNCSITATTMTDNTVAVNSQKSANTQTAQNTGNPLQNAETGAKDNQNSPDALIKDLYKTHDKDPGAILNGKNRTLIDKYFDTNLGDLIWKDLTTHKDEVGVLDFDPFYNTQDSDIKNLSIEPAKINGAKASVAVKFQNSGRKESLNFQLVRQRAIWKITDIKYPEGASLIGYFKENAKN